MNQICENNLNGFLKISGTPTNSLVPAMSIALQGESGFARSQSHTNRYDDPRGSIIPPFLFTGEKEGVPCDTGDNRIEESEAFHQRIHNELKRSRTIHSQLKQTKHDTRLNTWLGHQADRRNRVHDTCVKHSSGLHENVWERNVRYSQTIVDHNHRVVYCGMQKVAATTWLRLLSRITGVRGRYSIMSEKMRAKGVVPLALYADAERNAILQNYTTFLMVSSSL